MKKIDTENEKVKEKELHSLLEEVEKFKKIDNIKKLKENDINNLFKKAKQIISSIKTEQVKQRLKKFIEKVTNNNQKKQQILQYVNKKKQQIYLNQQEKIDYSQKQLSHIRIKTILRNIDQKINNFKNNLQNGTVKKKPKSSIEKYQKNIQVLQFHKLNLQQIITLLQNNKSKIKFITIYELINHTDILFVSLDDRVYLKDIQNIYNQLKKSDFETFQIPKREDGNSYFHMFLAISSQHIPRFNDFQPSIELKQKQNLNSLLPKSKSLTESQFENFSTDTLFFIFYFQKGTFEQYLAAKQLKQKKWRFHKKYMNWFIRTSQAKIEQSFEQGNYRFFDYQKSWSQKKKNEFVFKYKHMQDQTF